MRLPDYAEAFRTAALRQTEDGILTARLHYQEGPLTWTALAHREFPQLLDAVESDRANRVLVPVEGDGTVTIGSDGRRHDTSGPPAALRAEDDVTR